MERPPLDALSDHYQRLADEHEAFSRRYGANVGRFLIHLPSLLRLFRRIPFDGNLPLRVRQYAALVAYYLAENQDYLDDQSTESAGHIDDLYAAYTGLLRIVEVAGDEAIDTHWRSDAPFEDVYGLALNSDVLEAAMPSKVLDRASELLRIPK